MLFTSSVEGKHDFRSVSFSQLIKEQKCKEFMSPSTQHWLHTYLTRHQADPVEVNEIVTTTPKNNLIPKEERNKYFCGQFEYEVSPTSATGDESARTDSPYSSSYMTKSTIITERMVPVTKTVYLIRHAESDENRRLACLSRSVKGLGSLKLPKKDDLYASMELVNLQAQIDSDVSPKGRTQIEQLGKAIAGDDFVEKMGIQLVVHSPLKRARQTSEGMLGCVTETLSKGITIDEDSSASGCKAESVGRVEELDLLKERTPMEWLPINHDAFTRRIAEFEKWLGEQPEDVIAIVGHSQYFKSMLGLPKKFKNCDVWSAQFDYTVKMTHQSVKEDVSTAENEEKKKRLKTLFKDEKKDETEETQGEINDARDSAYVYEDSNEIYEIDGVRVDDVKLPRGWRDLKRHYTFNQTLPQK